MQHQHLALCRYRWVLMAFYEAWGVMLVRHPRPAGGNAHTFRGFPTGLPEGQQRGHI
jgi:hypothetical protein